MPKVLLSGLTLLFLGCVQTVDLEDTADPLDPESLFSLNANRDLYGTYVARPSDSPPAVSRLDIGPCTMSVTLRSGELITGPYWGYGSEWWGIIEHLANGEGPADVWTIDWSIIRFGSGSRFDGVTVRGIGASHPTRDSESVLVRDPAVNDKPRRQDFSCLPGLADYRGEVSVGMSADGGQPILVPFGVPARGLARSPGGHAVIAPPGYVLANESLAGVYTARDGTVLRIGPCFMELDTSYGDWRKGNYVAFAGPGTTAGTIDMDAREFGQPGFTSQGASQDRPWADGTAAISDPPWVDLWGFDLSADGSLQIASSLGWAFFTRTSGPNPEDDRWCLQTQPGWNR